MVRRWLLIADSHSNIVIQIGLSAILPILGTVASLAFLIPSIAVGVRRMHDVGKSGWFLLIPIYNLILACTPGESGTNEYGPDPKGSGLDDDIDAIGKN